MNGMMPIPGDPEGLRATADTLVAEARRMAALRRVLQALRAGEGWDSPAGRAFEERLRAVPPVLDRVAGRYLAGGLALRDFAAALEDAQRQTTAAMGLHREQARARDHWGEQMVLAESSADPVVREQSAGHRARMVAAGEEVFLAERRYLAARDAFAQADRRCAQSLRALAEDGLSDTLAYDALTGVGDLSGRVAFELEPLGAVPVPPLRPVQAAASGAGVLQTGSDVAVRILYGDGEVDAVGIAGSVAVAALGSGASWLRSSAKAPGVNGYGARLRAGAVLEARQRFRKTPAPAPPAAPRLPTPRQLRGLSGRARAEVLRGHAQARLEHEARVRFLDDWRVATANGPQAERLLIGALVAGGVSRDTARALETRDRLVARQERQKDREQPADR